MYMVVNERGILLVNEGLRKESRQQESLRQKMKVYGAAAK